MPLEQYPIRLTLPILWGHQDPFQHVNNTVFLRWFESGRVAYWHDEMRRVMEQQGLGPILANVTCNYRRQLNYPGTIIVATRVSRVGRSSLTMEHIILNQKTQEISADGHSVLVIFNYQTQKSSRITDELREAIRITEGKAL